MHETTGLVHRLPPRFLSLTAKCLT